MRFSSFRLFFLSSMAFLLFGTWPAPSTALEIPQIERRRSQFPSDFGYILTPMPFVLPGVGSGIGFLSAFNNVYDTPVDLIGLVIGGDVEGHIFGATDIPLVKEHWLLDVSNVSFNKGQQSRYLKRGMDSKRDEFNIVELRNTTLQGARTILTFFDRRLEFYGLFYNIAFQQSAVRDHQGRLETKIADPATFHVQSRTYGTLLDYTDDRNDPRRGLRLQIERAYSPPPTRSSIDAFILDYNLTAYIPIAPRHTWGFNYFRSDAFVIRKGQTDPDALKEDFGCEEAELELCSQAVREVLADEIAQNKYGSATSLGGHSRLRAFGEGRYNSAHSEFFATEFRWNLTDERTPFNIWIMKDFRTGIQVAFFGEVGSVADQRGRLWKTSRSTVGSGVRLITSSGFIYRFDLAYGQEGLSPILFVDYPWGSL